MNAFLDAISGVTGPLTLIAFLGVVLLAMYQRSVKDKRGLEYVYNLLQDKLTRDQFYSIARDVIRRGFWALIIVFLASLATFLADRLFGSDSQTVINVEGTYIETDSGDAVVVNAPVAGDLNIGAGVATPEPEGRSGNVVVAIPSEEPEPSDATAQDPAAGGDRIFAQGQGNLIFTEGTENLVMTKGRGNVVIASRRGQPVKIANPCFNPAAPSSTQAIDIESPGRATADLRVRYGLKRAPANDFEQRVGGLPDGLYGFGTSWTVGRQLSRDMPLLAENWGSARLEIHKRPGGVVAVVGFVTASDAAALERASAASAADIALYTAEWHDADIPVSIPIARIASVTHNGPKAAQLWTEEEALMENYDAAMEKLEDAMETDNPEELKTLEDATLDFDAFAVPDVLELTLR